MGATFSGLAVLALAAAPGIAYIVFVRCWAARIYNERHAARAVAIRNGYNSLAPSREPSAASNERDGDGDADGIVGGADDEGDSWSSSASSSSARRTRGGASSSLDSEARSQRRARATSRAQAPRLVLVDATTAPRARGDAPLRQAPRLARPTQRTEAATVALARTLHAHEQRVARARARAFQQRNPRYTYVGRELNGLTRSAAVTLGLFAAAWVLYFTAFESRSGTAAYAFLLMLGCLAPMCALAGAAKQLAGLLLCHRACTMICLFIVIIYLILLTGTFFDSTIARVSLPRSLVGALVAAAVLFCAGLTAELVCGVRAVSALLRTSTLNSSPFSPVDRGASATGVLAASGQALPLTVSDRDVLLLPSAAASRPPPPRYEEVVAALGACTDGCAAGANAASAGAAASAREVHAEAAAAPVSAGTGEASAAMRDAPPAYSTMPTDEAGIVRAPTSASLVVS